MKHVFESGITGTATCPTGEEFLRRMIETEKTENLGPIKPLDAEDLSFEIDDAALCAIKLADFREYDRLFSEFVKEAVSRGYEVTTWRDEAAQKTRGRLRKIEPRPGLQGSSFEGGSRTGRLSS